MNLQPGSAPLTFRRVAREARASSETLANWKSNRLRSRRGQSLALALEKETFLVHFYPRSARSSESPRESRDARAQRFSNCERGGLPPRRSAADNGFRLGDVVGDALLIESIEPGESFEKILTDRVNRIDLRHQLIEILHTLARGGLGHDRLTLDAFVVSTTSSTSCPQPARRVCGGLKCNGPARDRWSSP